ncbi:MAG TPA: hypothetical protein VIG70_12820 [Burkholderiales bacterium]|jgi:hypothetical protein
MPGANLPVQLARLPDLADGAFRAFVRFPAGWSRPGAGHYPVAEEFLVLEGDLRLNHVTWRGGGYAWIAANRIRVDSCSASGCLAFAWFAAGPRWIAGAPAEPAPSADTVFAHWRDAPGGKLYAGPEHRTWVAPGSQIPEGCEALDLTDLCWRAHARSETPAERSSVLARVWQRG